MLEVIKTIVIIVRNQYQLYNRLVHDCVRTFKSSIHLFLCDIAQRKIRANLNKQLVHNLLEKEKICHELEESIFSSEPIRITFAGAMRRLGNPNHKLERFLISLLNTTRNLEQVEVLAAIDSDDDIEYYLRLKRNYGNRFRLRFIISPIRYGYEKLHIYDKMLMPLMAPNSKMMCDYSDDAIITRANWDDDLLAFDALYPDNIYFIQTRITNRQEILGDVVKEPFRLLWIFQTYGCHSYFPIVSRGVLECADKALEALPAEERKNWSPFANAWITDCYADMIGTYLKAEGVDRVHELDMMVIKHGNHAQYQHDRDCRGMTASNRAFITMLGADTQAHLRRIAAALAKAVKPPKVVKIAELKQA